MSVPTGNSRLTQAPPDGAPGKLDPVAGGNASGARVSPLDAVHTAAGASFTDFGGWRMPLRYTSDLAEHHAVRTAVGLFDISHMAEFAVTGGQAGVFLDYALAGKISSISPGRAKYSLVLAPDGGIVDDVIVYMRDPGDYLVVANAANHDAVFAHFVHHIRGFAADLVDLTDDLAMLAIQGPRALYTLRALAGIVPATSAGRAPIADFGDLSYYASTDAIFDDGTEVIVARTGYTGEDGFELYVPAVAAEALWNAVVEAGRPFGLTLCGLACRDTLRLEAGMPLYGHELSLKTLPAEAGLSRVVAPLDETYVGVDGIRKSVESPNPARRVLAGLKGEGRRAARTGYLLYGSDAADASPIGEVTSGALSPTLGVPIAMAYIDQEAANVGTTIWADIRGRRLAMTVVKLPFYRRADRQPNPQTSS